MSSNFVSKILPFDQSKANNDDCKAKDSPNGDYLTKNNSAHSRCNEWNCIANEVRSNWSGAIDEAVIGRKSNRRCRHPNPKDCYEGSNC
ncbi:hypothetical protein GCM10009000_083670 [Halobacterium noricense]|uniref:Uncharacterized protein n=1 Tax=Haladaptatus pallidirubidus TaxID=1008152 RepID=A0AAV3URU6_9EURY